MSTARLTRGEKRAQTRAALLDAAERVFVDQGFQGASVEAISAEAGYSRGAFYSNFTTKEELFAELLQERVFERFRALARVSAGLTPRELGVRNAAIYARPEENWRFGLWLELMAHAGRDPAFRAKVARFWSGTREIGARVINEVFAEAGREPPADTHHLAATIIALDVGLALQHFVDPAVIPLGAWPELYELLLAPLRPG